MAALAAERRTEADLAQMRAAQSILMDRLLEGHGETATTRRFTPLSPARPKIPSCSTLSEHSHHTSSCWSRLSRERRILSLPSVARSSRSNTARLSPRVAERRADLARQALRRHLLNGRARRLSSLEADARAPKAVRQVQVRPCNKGGNDEEDTERCGLTAGRH